MPGAVGTVSRMTSAQDASLENVLIVFTVSGTVLTSAGL
jgi:hypothetical protein